MEREVRLRYRAVTLSEPANYRIDTVWHGGGRNESAKKMEACQVLRIYCHGLFVQVHEATMQGVDDEGIFGCRQKPAADGPIGARSYRRRKKLAGDVTESIQESSGRMHHRVASAHTPPYFRSKQTRIISDMYGNVGCRLGDNRGHRLLRWITLLSSSICMRHEGLWSRHVPAQRRMRSGALSHP